MPDMPDFKRTALLMIEIQLNQLMMLHGAIAALEPGGATDAPVLAMTPILAGDAARACQFSAWARDLLATVSSRQEAPAEQGPSPATSSSAATPAAAPVTTPQEEPLIVAPRTTTIQ